jgi:predicted N-formylglutamate amidohydrolase
MTNLTAEAAAFVVANPDGASPFLLLCDHASNTIPPRYGDMGLTHDERVSHIAWDPGALPVSERMAEAMDATLVYSTVSRLVIDCNRRFDASNLFWTLSENTRIAVNEELSPAERQFRIDNYYRPYHDAIAAVIDARVAAGRETIIACIHSYTPVYRGVPRGMTAGIIHGGDVTYSRAVLDALAAGAPDQVVEWNEPYASSDGVTFTLANHGDARGLDGTMIEVRNNEIADAAEQAAWALRLQNALEQARSRILSDQPRGKR